MTPTSTACTLTRHTLKGFVPAIVTPVSAEGAIVEEAFASIVEWLVGLGAEAICVAGADLEKVGRTLRACRLIG